MTQNKVQRTSISQDVIVVMIGNESVWDISYFEKWPKYVPPSAVLNREIIS